MALRPREEGIQNEEAVPLDASRMTSDAIGSDGSLRRTADHFD
jgi:hypothetical protein